jgi:hypothetical protein
MDGFKNWKLSGWNAPLRGFIYFIRSPNLWWRPLFSALLIFIVLIAIFSSTAAFYWPKSFDTWLSYFTQVLKSFGISLGFVVLFWVMGLPLLLTYFFSGFIKKILRMEKMTTYEENFSETLHGAFFILYKTLFWRIFWPVISILGAIFLGPAAIFIAHFGIGHILAIDGLDLALAFGGVKVERRYEIIKKAPLFSFACASSFLSLLLSITIIGVLFWFPSMLIATVLISENYFIKKHQ